jgi:hydroxypyruvate isomerase
MQAHRMQQATTNARKRAVNAAMTFVELPFDERISRLHEPGFRVGLCFHPNVCQFATADSRR